MWGSGWADRWGWRRLKGNEGHDRDERCAGPTAGDGTQGTTQGDTGRADDARMMGDMTSKVANRDGSGRSGRSFGKVLGGARGPFPKVDFGQFGRVPSERCEHAKSVFG